MTDIRAAQARYTTAIRELLDAVRDACPGNHVLTEHRDHQPPWCNTCGRTVLGLLIKETP